MEQRLVSFLSYPLGLVHGRVETNSGVQVFLSLRSFLCRRTGEINGFEGFYFISNALPFTQRNGQSRGGNKVIFIYLDLKLRYHML